MSMVFARDGAGDSDRSLRSRLHPRREAMYPDAPKCTRMSPNAPLFRVLEKRTHRGTFRHIPAHVAAHAQKWKNEPVSDTTFCPAGGYGISAGRGGLLPTSSTGE